MDDICASCVLLVSASDIRCAEYSPGDVNPDAGSMNYAIVVIAGVWLFAIAFWYFPRIGGKTFFT